MTADAQPDPPAKETEEAKAETLKTGQADGKAEEPKGGRSRPLPSPKKEARTEREEKEDSAIAKFAEMIKSGKGGSPVLSEAAIPEIHSADNRSEERGHPDRRGHLDIRRYP